VESVGCLISGPLGSVGAGVSAASQLFIDHDVKVMLVHVVTIAGFDGVTDTDGEAVSDGPGRSNFFCNKAEVAEEGNLKLSIGRHWRIIAQCCARRHLVRSGASGQSSFVDESVQ
jgi:hypothetical protein